MLHGEPVVPTGSEAPKTPYQPPQFRSVTFEQASLFLVGHAWNGDHDARDLLRLMFPLACEEPFKKM
jgi:hypothetical protein